MQNFFNFIDLDDTPTIGQPGHLEITETLMIICDWKGSKYLPYRKYETRQKSFDSCETDCMKVKAGDLAKSGFFYKGKWTYFTLFIYFFVDDKSKKPDASIFFKLW